MTASFFERVGGEDFFRALVDDFYAGVVGDPLLRPMYPDDDLPGASERLRLFLMQYWGGPETYSEQRGHPRLRMRHAPFPVSPEARDHWLEHMLAAVAKRGLAAELEAELVEYLKRTAFFLVNTGEGDERAGLPLV